MNINAHIPTHITWILSTIKEWIVYSVQQLELAVSDGYSSACSTNVLAQIGDNRSTRG
jgi:hypothetical protein